MQPDQLKERMNRIEQCADDARRAVQGAAIPNALRRNVEALHQQASEAKHRMQSGQQADEDTVRTIVMQLEQIGDRAEEACRDAGGSVDAPTQQAVQRVHDEVSRLKQEMLQQA